MKILSSADKPSILEALDCIVNPWWRFKPERPVKGIVDTAVESDTDLAFLVTMTPVENTDSATFCMSLELCKQGEYEPTQYMKKSSFIVNRQNCDSTLCRVADRIIAYTAEVE